jgi:hypothetical protein
VFSLKVEEGNVSSDLDGVVAVEEEVAVNGNYDRKANPNQQTHTQANHEQSSHTFFLKGSPETRLRLAATGRIVNPRLFPDYSQEIRTGLPRAEPPDRIWIVGVVPTPSSAFRLHAAGLGVHDTDY